MPQGWCLLLSTPQITADLLSNGIDVYPQKEFDEDSEDRLVNEKFRVGGSGPSAVPQVPQFLSVGVEGRAFRGPWKGPCFEPCRCIPGWEGMESGAQGSSLRAQGRDWPL